MSTVALVSSLGLALVLLLPLGWKWRMPMSVVVPGAFVIGLLTGVIVGAIDSMRLDLALPIMVLIEAFVIFAAASIAVMLRFYRDPERTPPDEDNVLLSPADGDVIYVKELQKGSSIISAKGGRQFELTELAATSSLDDAAYLVGIGMNMLNIHVNRSPIAGKIVLQKRVNGSFVSLRRPESEIVNERVTTIVDNGQFSVGVIQIASRLVRRIVSYLQEGDAVAVGQRIGMIRFGSQVDVVIPKLDHLEVVVKPGDKVKAGTSPIARYG